MKPRRKHHEPAIVVANFLMSLSGDESQDRLNLELDARLYGWPCRTETSIREGIDAFYAERKKRCVQSA